MIRSCWILLLVALSAAQARAEDGCMSVTGHSGPFTCPGGATCGTFITTQTAKCNEQNGCANAYPTQICLRSVASTNAHHLIHTSTAVYVSPGR